MDKVVKIIVLSSGKTLITQIIEEEPEDLGSPDWRLINPHEIESENKLEPWLKNYTDQTVFMIVSDTILTVVEPKKDLLEKYLEKTK